MGTVLSIYPTTKNEAILDEGGTMQLKQGASPCLSQLSHLRKRFSNRPRKRVARKSSQTPHSHVNQLNNENNKKSLQSSTDGKKGPLTVPVPMVTTQSLQPNQPQVPSKNVELLAVQKQPSKVDLLSPRCVIIQASTGELLRCLGEFTCRRCYKLKLTYSEVIIWFRKVDQTLLLQGWQDQGFITTANLVLSTCSVRYQYPMISIAYPKSIVSSCSVSIYPTRTWVARYLTL
ncbi:unnamed protein product [Oncorhynchus mykiss]|uniref:Uncharacterized protein n=1 Tax=Oncorhynchus mykiss TaxID=8022 RepID=A0A060VSK9_ONCMY|nr:unnamed protein product [Oncorhynchus mykiss]